ncbi:MAG: DNA repair protein RecN [Bacteroidetes bacterium GWE2_29_8]|nr:MAG: DNA repair protein RecN [Bacteroidetes bacterium GWE2_29_8]OFY19143.1 MAG: DNA repair protein RecN [Bacteroidetes bacterium GWF2_29_10]
MLLSLYIDNYILINKLQMQFDNTLNIITGETGSGKSILLGALGLIKGNRSDSEVLFEKDKKCIIEAVFDINNYDLDDFFKTNELDYESHTIIRREITPNGKSRAFINDTPVSLSTIKELTSTLIDIHSQNNNLLLNKYDFQLSLIDQFAQNKLLLEEYRDRFKVLTSLKRQLNILIGTENENKKDYDYNLYLFNELQGIEFDNEVFLHLEKESETLLHSEEIGVAISKSLYQLEDNEHSAYSILSDTYITINKVKSFNENLENISSKLFNQLNELKEISKDLNNLSSIINADPERLNYINEKLDIVYTLQKKHRLNSFEALIDFRKELELKLQSVDNLGEEIESVKEKISIIQLELIEKAKIISERRQATFELIINKIKELLGILGIPHAEFVIKHEILQQVESEGIDKIFFLFNANKGGEPKEINKTASGGEISRLMLSLKSLISEKNLISTIIFDEIDTGISGKIADQTGKLLCDMSDNMQVIAITHSPQIAAKGKCHFMVYKLENEEKTYSEIKKLDYDDRVKQIAQMLSGENVSKEAINNAKILLT